MLFEDDRLYHIYNQGNNKINIFYNKKNYIYFKEKIWEYILPYADIIAYALLPNHFHLIVYINKVELTHGVTPSHAVSKTRSLNDSPFGLLNNQYC